MRWLPFLALLFVSAFWGGHAIVGKAVEAQFSPIALVTWRFTLGALVYTPLFPRLFRMCRQSPRLVWQFVLTGLFWAILYPLFYYQSLRFISPVQSLLLINTAPLIATFFGWLVLREHIRWTQSLGICVAFLGVVWETAGQWGKQASLAGAILALASAAAFAAYTVSARSLIRISMCDMLAATSLCGAIESWTLVLCSGHAGSVWHSLAGLHPDAWVELVYIVLIVNTVSYMFYAYGLRRFTAAVSSALTFYPQAVFATIIQWTWMGIRPTWMVMESAALILGGVVLMHLRVRPRGTSLRLDRSS